MSVDFRPRRRGVSVDPARLDRQLAARGLESQDIARLAGVSEDTIARLRNGERIERNNLYKVVAALDKVRPHPMLADLVGVDVPPGKKRTATAVTSAAVEEVPRGTSTQPPD